MDKAMKDSGDLMPETVESITRRKCFIVTPIGSQDDPIRRAIDGVIDSAIKPILEESFNFQVDVSHRMYTPGKITTQIMRRLLEDELVIANLTGLNPNVMYEVAVRHAKRLPIVHICEFGTPFPFDISDVRTVRYTNDMLGVMELKENLLKSVEAALEDKEIENPIYSATTMSNIMQDVSVNDSEKQLGAFVVDRFERLEYVLGTLMTRHEQSPSRSREQEYRFEIEVMLLSPDESIKPFAVEYVQDLIHDGLESVWQNASITITSLTKRSDNMRFTIRMIVPSGPVNAKTLGSIIAKIAPDVFGLVDISPYKISKI